MDAVKLKISQNYFVDNAELLLPALKDKTGGLIESTIKAWLEWTYNLTPKTRTEKGITRDGYDAKELNKVLRDKMKDIEGIHKETCVNWGALTSKGHEGFDFSFFDEEYNIVKIRNAFIGNPGRYDGDRLLESIYKQVPKSGDGSYTKREWKEKIKSLGETLNQKHDDCHKERLTIVGEIQFGNWALAEHDLLRLMRSAVDGEIDYYIYITATGELERKLSSGIVTYSKAIDLFKNNKQLFRTPVWIIGLDIAN